MGTSSSSRAPGGGGSQERVEGGVLALEWDADPDVGRGCTLVGQGGPGRSSGWGWAHLGSPVLFLQPGHGTGSWAQQTPGSTTWRSQMPSSLTTPLTSARPRRPPCAPGERNSPCSVITPDILQGPQPPVSVSWHPGCPPFSNFLFYFPASPSLFLASCLPPLSP